MNKTNKIFIATSIDGYISDRNDGLKWLNSIPNPDNFDMGYNDFMSGIDAIVMGRKTFETVCSFDIDWPYKKPVFILSNTLNKIPENLQDKAFLIKGLLYEILNQIHRKGFFKLYIDGGKTIQSFLKEDLIDEMTITILPVLLGGGSELFSVLPEELKFELVSSQIYLNTLVQNHYRRKR